MIGFGKFGKQRNMKIVSLDDKRLMRIDPTEKGFFDNVLCYETQSDSINDFIEAVCEVKEEKLSTFWIPIYDVSLCNDDVLFEKGYYAAVGHSFSFWKEKLKRMYTVSEKHWEIGSEYQYYAFLVWLINMLVKTGWKIDNAIKAVVIDSKELGHYRNSDGALNAFEKTGARGHCGIYDLGNTNKLLKCTNKYNAFWLAGGNCRRESKICPLANLEYKTCNNIDNIHGVAWFVLL